LAGLLRRPRPLDVPDQQPSRSDREHDRSTKPANEDDDPGGPGKIGAALRFLHPPPELPYITHMNQLERRAAPRVAVSVYVQQHVGGQTHRCHARSLSLSGLYMERPLESFHRQSAQFALEIPLPDGNAGPIWADAEVVYDCFDARSHGTGVRFVAMRPGDRDRLFAFLTRAIEPDRGRAHAS
jgi:hypothetical protein